MDPKDQFDRQAKFYSNSSTFSSGLSLKLLSNLLLGKEFSQGLDIGTGSGFTAFELSNNCDSVEAIDISSGMLEEAEKIKQKRNIDNVNFKIGFAENLEYADSSFDIITCRTAAHHFEDLSKALDEINRVLKDKGSVYVIDTITSDQKSLNDWHQKIEIMRDQSHVKNYSLLEWKKYFLNSNLNLIEIFQTRVNMNLEDWMERSGTSMKSKKILRNEFENADNKVKKFFGIEKIRNNHNFYWPVGLFYLKKTNSF